MNLDEKLRQEVAAALERDARVDVHHYQVKLSCEGGVVTLEGEMADVAAKKIAMEAAAAVPGVGGIVDRLTVKPAAIMQDGELGTLLFHALLEESAFNDFSIRVTGRGIEIGSRGTARQPIGSIEADVVDGTITLNGEVESYAHKALAGVLAWWKRGTRNVLNCLEVAHPMSDPDGEMTDALRIVLEKDRLVTASQIRGVCRDFAVTLDGIVAREGDRQMAEADAWYLFGVNDVVNNIIVRE